MAVAPDVGHAVGDARKRLLEQSNFDEQHAHLDEWPDPDEMDQS